MCKINSFNGSFDFNKKEIKRKRKRNFLFCQKKSMQKKNENVGACVIMKKFYNGNRNFF